MRLTTIGLSAEMPDVSAPDPQPKPVVWKKRIASIWIPAILGLGLLTAFAYVGVRIVAGKSQTAAPVVAKETPALAPAAPSPVSQPQPASKPVSTAPAQAMPFTVITPLPGERYLQVAAVSPHMVLIYIDTLREIKMDAVVAPGPTPDLLRILVGPFADRDSIDKAMDQLRSSGRSPIVRSY